MRRDLPPPHGQALNQSAANHAQQPQAVAGRRQRVRAPRRTLRLGLIAAAVVLLGAGGLGVGSGGAEAQVGTIGQWSNPITWQNVAIHTTVLPTGKVMQYSYPQDDAGSEAWLWNPSNSAFQEVPVADDTNIFCSGHALLPNGQLISVGGTDPDSPLPDFWGHNEINRFNTTTQQWSYQGAMQRSRWYPTITTLSDGKLMITSGLDQNGNATNKIEVYDPSSGSSTLLPTSADKFVPLYPWQHLLPNGRVVSVGSHDLTETLNLSNNTWSAVDNTNFGARDAGTSVLLPLKAPGYNPEVMIIGGSYPTATNTTERINMGAGSPSWSYADNLNHARRHVNAVLLPTGKVLATGGTLVENDPANAVYQAEMYDPVANTWTDMASMQRPRMYHSTSILLPDGRVLTAGTDGELTGEIYSPPYLFQGVRPTISASPAAVGWGTNFQVTSPVAASISKVMLMKPSSVTHSVNMGQRAVELSFTTGAGTLTITAPPNGSVAPPGYYMLFLVDSSGVPSVAKWVHVSGSPPPPSDTDGDGYTDSNEALIGTDAGAPCGDNWPSNVFNDEGSWNKLDIQDIVSFISPVRRIDASPADPGYDARWDVSPGPTPPFDDHINITDLTALTNGTTGSPPMLNGERAFNQTCPFAP